MATDLDMPDVVSSLNDMETAFGPFYAEGKEMAQSYIDEGPTVGNQHMNDFDAVAAAISNASDVLNKRVDAKTDEHLQMLKAAAKKINASNAQQITILAALALLSLLVATLGLIYIFRIMLACY